MAPRAVRAKPPLREPGVGFYLARWLALAPRGAGKKDQNGSQANWMSGSMFHNGYYQLSWRSLLPGLAPCPAVAAESSLLKSEFIRSRKYRGIRRGHMVLLDFVQYCPITNLE